MPPPRLLFLGDRTGTWSLRDAGVGSGADSYYEYLLKGYIMTGDDELLKVFSDAGGGLRRRVWPACGGASA